MQDHRYQPSSPLKFPPGRAFTLIELLVTIAIIGILATLLLGALGGAKAASQSARCKSNLRQLAIAMRLYVDDHARFPRANDAVRAAEMWWGRLMPYALGRSRPLPYIVTNEHIPEIFREPFLCTVRRPGGFGMGGSDVNGMRYELRFDKEHQVPYGYNATGTTDPITLSTLLAGQSPERRLGLGVDCPESGVLAPSEMFAFTCAAIVTWERRVSPYINSPGIRGGQLGRIHRQGLNAAFVDGHVEYGKTARVTEASESARRRWNRDNLPHRET